MSRFSNCFDLEQLKEDGSPVSGSNFTLPLSVNSLLNPPLKHIHISILAFLHISLHLSHPTFLKK